MIISSRQPIKPHSSAKTEKSEIGMLLGEKTELRLGPLDKALTGETARTDGNFTLNDVIAAPETRAFRVQKIENPVFLVRA